MLPRLGRALSADPRPPAGWDARALAHAATLTWPRAVIGFQVAGSLIGFPIPPEELIGPVQVYLQARQRCRPGLMAHRRGQQPQEVIRLRDGLALTGEFQTMIDCLRAMAPANAEVLYAWLSTRGRLSHADLGAGLRMLHGRMGVGALRQLHARTADGAVSEAERRAHAILHQSGITGWIAGARVFDRQGPIGVVDLLFPEAWVVVEINGRQAHSDPDQFDRARQRQNRLIRAGYLVLRYTWRQLTTEPERVATEITAVLADRELGLQK